MRGYSQAGPGQPFGVTGPPISRLERGQGALWGLDPERGQGDRAFREDGWSPGKKEGRADYIIFQSFQKACKDLWAARLTVGLCANIFWSDLSK